ncbi:ABC transporter substrate-binding protein [Herbidospora sp. RD11066]
MKGTLMSVKFPARLAAAAAVVTLAGAACSSGSTVTETKDGGSAPAPSGGTVTVRMGAAPDTLDPFKTVTGSSGPVTYSTYDTLVQFNPTTKEYTGVVVESWDLTPASIKFKVKPGVTCADGTKFLPSGMAASLEAYLDPKTGSPYATRWLGKAPLTITPDDAGLTLTITAAKPFGALLSGLKMVPLVCPAGLKDRASLASKANGSGPYELTASTPGIAYTLKLRDDYTWGTNGFKPGAPGVPSTFNLKVIANTATAANELLAGTIDVADIAGVDVERVSADKSITRIDLATQGQYAVVGNQEKSRVTADPEVRHALYQGVDRKGLLLAMLGPSGGELELGTSVIPPNMPGYDPSTASLVPQFSVDGAKATLRAAGWTESAGKWTKDGKTLKVRMIGTGDWGNANELLASQIKALGVEVDLSVTDGNGWLADLSSGNYDVTIYPIDGSVEAPSALLPFYLGTLPPGGSNFIRSENADLSKLADDTAALVGPEADKGWATIQAELLKNYSLLPWMVPVGSYFTAAGVSLDTNGSPLTQAIRQTKG